MTTVPEENGDTRLARIEVKLDMMIERLNEVRTDHEARLRTLERWKYAIPASAVMAATSAAVAIFGR